MSILNYKYIQLYYLIINTCMLRETKKITEEEIPEDIQRMFNYVASHLLSMSGHYLKRYDKNEPVSLGNGQFWLIRDESTICLGFNIQPREWDVDAIVDSIREREHTMFEEKGIAFNPPIDY